MGSDLQRTLDMGRAQSVAAAVLFGEAPDLRATGRSWGLVLFLLEGDPQSRLLGFGRSWCRDWKPEVFFCHFLHRPSSPRAVFPIEAAS